MTKNRFGPQFMKMIIMALVAETACIGAGVAAWLSTDKIIWLFIGIVASLGFSLPVAIKLVRASKGQ